MKTSNDEMSRRLFLEQSARGAGLLALAGAGLSAASCGASASAQATNPFAYDLRGMTRTDPGLIHYEQVARFPVLPDPRRLAVGPDGRLYVAGRTGVGVFGEDGSRIQEMGLSAPARCVAVAADGTIYAGVRNHIEVFEAGGRRLAAWESLGEKTWLTGLAVGKNEVFAADSGTRLILRYDRSGKLIGRIGAKNKARNIPGLIVPSPYLDVEAAPDGLLRVNNPGQHRIEAYTAEGDFEFSWGKASGTIEGFCGCCNPVGLALLADGRCVTCEKGLPRVKVFSADGTFECVVAGAESFPENANNKAARNPSDGMLGGLDAAVDKQGRVYVLDLVAADVRVMKRKG